MRAKNSVRIHLDHLGDPSLLFLPQEGSSGKSAKRGKSAELEII